MLAHAANVKVFVAVGGYNDSQYFSPIAADPVSRANFISELTAFYVFFKADGVHHFWSCASNTNVAGFSVLRASDRVGVFRKLIPTFLFYTLDENEQATYIDIISHGQEWYKLHVVSVDGREKIFGPIFAQQVTLANESNFNRTFHVYQNYPNPFNPETHIAFDVAFKEQVLLEIFDMRGQSIKKLINDYLSPGRHEIEWDATDELGHVVPAGVYFYRVSAGEFVKTHKMILMR